MGIQSELNNILTEMNHQLANYKNINHDFLIEFNSKSKCYELQVKLQLRDGYRNSFNPFVYRYNDNFSVSENIKRCIEEYKDLCFEKL